VRIFGTLTIEQDGEFARRVHRQAEAWDSCAAVVDFTHCRVNLNPDQAMTTVPPVLAEVRATPRPIAVIVRREDVPKFEDYATRVSGCGALRAVFIDAEHAAAWAIEKGGIWRAMRDRRREAATSV
jgi:hypothetical protein